MPTDKKISTDSGTVTHLMLAHGVKPWGIWGVFEDQHTQAHAGRLLDHSHPPCSDCGKPTRPGETLCPHCLACPAGDDCAEEPCPYG